MRNSFLRTGFCFWSLFALACASLFWPGLVSGEVPVFRDAFHFYYPQAVWLDQCALQGDFFPQWQCNESLGVNIPGETTSALYYPLRIIWFLPSLSVAQRFAAFVLTHILLAAIGMQYACTRMRLRKEAGWLAGATFALSCPVLFQHNNLVFLSSAAWLGFVLAELSCWLFQPEADAHKPRLAVFAGAIAMMVLAGDPHTAVNVCIVSTFLIVGRGIALRSSKWIAKSLLFLASMVLLAVGLSAVQSIQSLHWANQSHRWLSNNRSVVNKLETNEQPTAPEQSVPNKLAELLSEPTRRSPGAIYEFSLSPWHLLTTLWPTLGGNFFPENSRTFSLIAAEGRMWIPSLFFGVVPLLLLIGGFRRPHAAKFNWLLLAAIFALLASFGNYSLGWLFRESLDAIGLDSLSRQFPPDHYSSLYGLLAEWLPGYSVFRYPAKWTVIAVASASLAAAVRFDRFYDADLLQRSMVQLFVLVLSGIGLFLTLAYSLFLSDFLPWRPLIRPDAWLGAPNDGAMLRQVLFAFAIPIVVLGLLSLVRWHERHLMLSANRLQLPVHALFAWIALLETFIVATCWCSFVAVEPTEYVGAWSSQFVWSDVSEANIEGDRWLSDADADASVEFADYQRAFGLGKLGLLTGQHNLASLLSIEPDRIKRLRSGLAKLDDLSFEQPELESTLAWLGVQQRLVRARQKLGRASFTWQAIRNSMQLCELTFDYPANSQDATVNWRWTKCGQLEIAIDSPAKCSLLVRQFNDDGWYAVSDRETSLKLAHDSSCLFITCDVDSGKTKLILERIQWPQQLGAAISLTSLLLALAIGYFQPRIASATKSRSK